MKKILVLCTGNSCRSQMAHAFLEKFAQERAQIWSAGVETHGLNPNAVKYLAEYGLDISHHTSNLVSEYEDVNFDFVITVCDHANERCPVFPSTAKKMHQNFSDPSKVEGTEEEIAVAFRATIREIEQFCSDFVEANL
ncbi:MAG: arsenate reductase ArsC [Flavobacteriales bacterium]|nr:arsenate reductase ArsC [Flavobacteriales bacterium]